MKLHLTALTVMLFTTNELLAQQLDYLLSSCDDLQQINHDYNGHYQLTQNIDCAGIDFIPIGTSETPFTGVLDGNHYSITNLTIQRPQENQVALFRATQNASIKNLHLQDSLIVGMMKNIATLIANSDYTTIRNVSATGNVWGVGGSSSVGGLIANSHESIIQESSAQVDVIALGYADVGGLIGQNYDGSIENCYATGKVSGQYLVGGLIGTNAVTSVANSFAAGQVIGAIGSTGGLIGSGDPHSLIKNSYWDIDTTQQFTSAGGQGVPHEKMKLIATYESWDFDVIWDIDEGNSYPWLCHSNLCNKN